MCALYCQCVSRVILACTQNVRFSSFLSMCYCFFLLARRFYFISGFFASIFICILFTISIFLAVNIRCMFQIIVYFIWTGHSQYLLSNEFVSNSATQNIFEKFNSKKKKNEEMKQTIHTDWKWLIKLKHNRFIWFAKIL